MWFNAFTLASSVRLMATNNISVVEAGGTAVRMYMISAQLTPSSYETIACESSSHMSLSMECTDFKKHMGKMNSMNLRE
jgi:hypothetical protein